MKFDPMKFFLTTESFEPDFRKSARALCSNCIHGYSDDMTHPCDKCEVAASRNFFEADEHLVTDVKYFELNTQNIKDFIEITGYNL